MGDCSHQPVEVLVAHWPQIEVGHCRLHHSGVGFGPALSMGLKGQFSCNILMEKAQDVYLFSSDCVHTGAVQYHDSKERARTTRGHVITPWGGEGCWVNSSKISEF